MSDGFFYEQSATAVHCNITNLFIIPLHPDKTLSTMAKHQPSKEPSKISQLTDRITSFINYCWTGVWKDPRNKRSVKIIKVINLSVRSFLDRGLQSRSMSLTYSTVLAIVPAMALLFAIGRGFGFQNLLEKQLLDSFPAQRQFIQFSLKFVDTYLQEASQGVFVGIGLLFLLWTLISLLSYIEEAFNSIWDIKHDRSLYKKITDYTAICLMVPILLICSSGLSIFMSATLLDKLHFAFLTPLVNIVLEASPVVLAWLAFTLSYFLIPNTKVKFKYAAISGAVCAVAFQIVQLLFVNGQLYVSKYNAIYGSFSLLPLLLIWLQLSWLILLLGCVLTYSMQNVLGFNFIGDVFSVSSIYGRKLAILLFAAISQRFREGKPALTRSQLSFLHDIPIRIVSGLCERFQKAGLVNFVILPDDKTGVAPASETSGMTVGAFLRKIGSVGEADFIPGLAEAYPEQLKTIDVWLDKSYSVLDDQLLSQLDVPALQREEN